MTATAVQEGEKPGLVDRIKSKLSHDSSDTVLETKTSSNNSEGLASATNGQNNGNVNGDANGITNGTTESHINGAAASPRGEPLQLSGALDQFKHFEVTPVIGREYVDVDLEEWLKAENSDALIRDLAITVSQRGVVFFRAQNNIDDTLQKQLAQRLGELSGKPETSKLHIHPVINSERDLGGEDNEISIISSKQSKKLYSKAFGHGFANKRQNGKDQWHSDITFEPVPSDYAILRLTELPGHGGDTLWASGYELYDRLSTPYQNFLSTLTATYSQPLFNETARINKFPLFKGPRGAPENVGEELTAIHPVVRTNPVTGWRSIFAVGHHVSRINEVTEWESRKLLDWFVELITGNHDLQVRLRWQSPNDLAIWDNRSVYHAATPDYEGLGDRLGHRAVSLGERPYFDEKSKGRREVLAELAELTGTTNEKEKGTGEAAEAGAKEQQEKEPGEEAVTSTA